MRHRGSVRLCNTNGCHQPFPCAMHDGALALKASCERIRLNIRAGLGTEDRTYPCCGRHVCSCVKAPEPITTDTERPREGWTKHKRCTSGEVLCECMERGRFHVFPCGRATFAGEKRFVVRGNMCLGMGNDLERKEFSALAEALEHVERQLQAEDAAKADALPDGWERSLEHSREQYDHESGAAVWTVADLWAWAPATSDISQGLNRTRAEAMRLALGGKP